MLRGEVWWVIFDPLVGGAINKNRPGVIVSNDDANQYLNRVLVVPTTSAISRVYPGETIVEFAGGRSKAMADQLTTVSKMRVGKKIGKLSADDLRAVDQAIRVQLGLTLGQ